MNVKAASVLKLHQVLAVERGAIIADVQPVTFEAQGYVCVCE
jgi:hypothetical protein